MRLTRITTTYWISGGNTQKKKQDRSCSPLLSFMMRPSEEWAEKPHCAPHLSLCRVSHWEQNRDGLSPSQSRLSQLRPFSLWHSWDWGADYYLHRHTDSTVCRAAPARRKGPHFILLYVFAAAGTSYSRLNDDDKKYTNKKRPHIRLIHDYSECFFFHSLV